MAASRPIRSSQRTVVVRAARQKRWTSSVAGDVLDAWRESGQSLATFAGRHDLAYARLLRWRTRLSRGTQDPARPPLFLPVSIKPDVTTEVAPGSSSIEIVVRGDRRVRVGVGFDGSTVARVVELLEGLPC